MALFFKSFTKKKGRKKNIKKKITIEVRNDWEERGEGLTYPTKKP